MDDSAHTLSPTPILMVASHFPPANFSGTARPMYFFKCLKEFGYLPYMLTAREYPDWVKIDPSLLGEIEGRGVVRHVSPWRPPAALQRLLRILPRGWRLANLLEGYGQWLLPAIAAGVRMVRKHRLRLVWATGDPWITLGVGLAVARLTQRPFIADMRDPWTYGPLWQPESPERARRERRRERRVLTAADRVVFTSPLTAEIVRRKVSAPTGRRFVTITNGFEETHVEPRRDAPEDNLLLRYIGNLQQRHRRPAVFFEALRRLIAEHPDVADCLRVEFYGGMDGFENDIPAYGLENVVFPMGFVSQGESRRRMRGADVLVLIQTLQGPGEDCVSGKAFEYLASGRPILGVINRSGGDAWLLEKTGGGKIAGITDPDAIARAVYEFVTSWREGRLEELATSNVISQYTRRRLTGELAELFDEVLAERS